MVGPGDARRLLLPVACRTRAYGAEGATVLRVLAVLREGLAGMCTDDFDDSDCGTAVFTALAPGTVAVVALLLALVALGVRTPERVRGFAGAAIAMDVLLMMVVAGSFAAGL